MRSALLEPVDRGARAREHDVEPGDRAWGYGTDVGGAGYLATPTTVTGLADVVEMRGGTDLTCARRSDGTVACWARPESLAPVAGITDAVQLAHTAAGQCVRRATGNVLCWGAGYPGNGTLVQATPPTEASNIDDAVDIATGGSSSYARRAGGDVECWGSNT